jgi:hypothetical protein
MNLAPSTTAGPEKKIQGDTRPPIVVQLGFSGSRLLLDAAEHPDIEPATFHEAVERMLMERLAELPRELGLSPHHFLCGHSQIAIGADMLFTSACRTLEIPQRILLPQPLDDYLAAKSSGGEPDFTPGQQAAARQLLASPHIIHEQVVSGAANRNGRFEEVNLELARISDALICLRRADAPGKPGGTIAMLELAKRRRYPVLDIQVAVENGEPKFISTWYFREKFTPPQLPGDLEELKIPLLPGPLPELDKYCEPLRAYASAQSKRQRDFFKRAALFIVGGHVTATICAVVALVYHDKALVPWLLGGELLLLAGSLFANFYVHHSRAVHTWALSRLVSEIIRSVRAAGAMHVYLNYLFALPFPPGIRPLLRTLNVLHLRSTRSLPSSDWNERRTRYVHSRLTERPSGQIGYYSETLVKAKMWLGIARATFYSCSLIAIVATLAKLSMVGVVEHVAHDWGFLESGLGSLAVILPVLAVAALSLAASLDLEALVHTYSDILAFLEKQEGWLTEAVSEREFAKLALETESHLLGETATWASRRSFKGVD